MGGEGADSRGEKWEKLLQIMTSRNQKEEQTQRSSAAEREKPHAGDRNPATHIHSKLYGILWNIAVIGVIKS